MSDVSVVAIDFQTKNDETDDTDFLHFTELVGPRLLTLAPLTSSPTPLLPHYLERLLTLLPQIP